MSHPSETSGRPTGSPADPAYALARSREEYERLTRQAAFLRGTTERLFRAAGLEPGMRVLDVGRGAGDVALLAAELVGPEGEVVGVDVDGAALETARVRPGGVVVFQELDFDPAVGSRSLPEGALWNRTGRLVIDAVARGAVVWTPSFVGAYARRPGRTHPEGPTGAPGRS